WPRDGREPRHHRLVVAVRPDPGLGGRVAPLQGVGLGPGAHERLEGPVATRPAPRPPHRWRGARYILAGATPSSSLAQDATLSRSRSRVRIPPGSPLISPRFLRLLARFDGRARDLRKPHKDPRRPPP